MFRKRMCTLISIASLLALSTPIFAKEFIIEQKSKQFVANHQIITKFEVKKGDSIRFKNLDPWRHNIFSNSELMRFDLGSYPQGKSRTQPFNKKGQVDVECAIHPDMTLSVTVK